MQSLTSVASNASVADGGRLGPATADAAVVSAWQSRAMSDGTKLQLGRTDQEQGFVVRDGGVFPISFKKSGTQICEDGSRRLANVINVDSIRPHAGGHTHPLGRAGDVSGLPGPEDGRLAAATGQPAYVISRRGAFAIEHRGNTFEVRQLAGKPLTPTEQGEVSRVTAQWNQNSGGSGVRCTFVPH